MRAIQFEQGADKVITVRYGESAFKKTDDFWFDFKPDGGEKTTSFCPNLVPDTEDNRAAVDELIANSIAKKAADDEFDRKMYQILNKLKR